MAVSGNVTPLACLHERRREVRAGGPDKYWSVTYCRDCKEEVIEHRGVWITRGMTEGRA